MTIFSISFGVAWFAGKSPRCLAVFTPSPTENPLAIAIFAFLVSDADSFAVIMATFLNEIWLEIMSLPIFSVLAVLFFVVEKI